MNSPSNINYAITIIKSSIPPPPSSPFSTSTTHTYTHNPAQDTLHASQTNPAHDAHEIHDYTPYKTPLTSLPSPLALDSPLHPACSGPDYRATTCRYRSGAFAFRNSDKRARETMWRVSDSESGRGDEVSRSNGDVYST
jgi:hypothetical protein